LTPYPTAVSAARREVRRRLDATGWLAEDAVDAELAVVLRQSRRRCSACHQPAAGQTSPQLPQALHAGGQCADRLVEPRQALGQLGFGVGEMLHGGQARRDVEMPTIRRTADGRRIR
jgi:hypothetical protein